MSTRVVDQVDDWTEESFSGGYRELHALADRDFSGVVRAGGAELYMTRGVVVGVRMGDIEDFEEASGTLYEAPADALPLLAIMQEEDVDVRAKYYSEKTSISKVDGTLSDGGFTGYIELSENVLSGDYYLVYHAGQSMSVAYVGESGKLLQGDEAFETADDEVGIFKVRQVDIEPVEIPEPEEPITAPADDPTPDTSGMSTEGASSQSPEHDDTAESESTAQDPDPESGAADQQTGSPAGDSDSAVRASEESGTATAGGSGAQTADDSGTAAKAVDDSDGGTKATDTAETARTDRSQTTADRSTETTDGSRGSSGTAQTADRSEPATSNARQQSEPTGRDRQSPDTNGRRESETSTESRQTAETAPRERQSAGQARDRGGATSSQRTQDTQRSRETAGTQPRGGNSSRTQQSQGRQAGTPRRSSAGGASADLETKSIPSIDPSNTSIPEDTASEPPAPRSTGVDQRTAANSQQPEQHTQRAAANSQQSEPRDQRATANSQQSEPRDQPASPQEHGDQSPAQQSQPSPSAETPEENGAAPEQSESPSVDSERLSELESELEEKDETIDQLESELEAATEERDDLQSELEAVEAERDELASEVERLETELERLEDELGAATNAERRLTSEEALAGTDIFVRYRSKGKATLKKAHGGSTRKDEVNDNLRLEKHTQFDADSVSVGGQSYEEFLENTLEFQFVRWAVRELLFEIRETGHEKALRNLYDVLPLIDRAELSGVVEVTYTEDGQETQSQESFDVVLRDRMGHPLLAANLNDSRDATTEAMMERLITSAERVGQANDDFSAAFLVTESFFDPGALEVTSQATQGGLLSRDKRKSFVNLSRKQGYHLCLVEARSENFHLAVPEL